MAKNFITYMRLIYDESKKEGGGKYNELQSKVTQWMESNKQEVDAIKKKLFDEIEKREKFLFELKLPPVRSILREFRGVEYKGLDDAYYKIALDFVNSRFIGLSLNNFLHFVIEKKSLTKEQIQTFLMSRHIEADDNSIDRYIAHLNNPDTDVRQRIQCHSTFFYSLKQKVQEEDAETLHLMAAILLFNLVNNKRWSMCITSGEIEESIFDMACLLADYSHTFSLHPHIDNFIGEFFQLLEKNADFHQNKSIIPVKNQDKIVNLMLGYFIQSLHSEMLMSFFLRIDALGMFYSTYITHPLTITGLSENTQLVALSSGIFYGEREIEKSIHVDKIVLLNVLKMVNSPVILNRLQRSGIFLHIKEDLLNKNDIVAISNAFCAATNANTTKIWKIISFSLFLKFLEVNKEKCMEIFNKYPDLKNYMFIKKIIQCFDANVDQFYYLKEHPKRIPDKVNMLSDFTRFLEDLFESLLAHADYLPLFFKENEVDIRVVRDIMIFMLLASNYNAKAKDASYKIVSAIDFINKNKVINAEFLTDEFFLALSKMKTHIKNHALSLSNFIEEEYKKWEAARQQALPAAKPVLSELQLAQNKELVADFQKNTNNQVALSPVIKKPNKSSKRKKKKAKPQRVEKVTIKLNQAEQDDFIKSLCASVAGDTRVKFEWTDSAEDEAGYFRLNFSDVGHEFQVHEKIDKIPQRITLTDEAREKFLTQYLPALFRDHLGEDVSVILKEDGLCITPKKTRCPYPDEMLRASWNYLAKYGNFIEKANVNPPVIEQQAAVSFKIKKLTPYYSTLAQPASTLTQGPRPDPLMDANPAELVNTQALPEQSIQQIKRIYREMVVDFLPEQEFHFIALKQDHNRFVINVNVKGAPNLSCNNDRVDTYVVMKSIVMALREMCGDRFSITPDELNPDRYLNKPCVIFIKATKDKLESLAAELSNSVELRKLFNEYFKANRAIVSCYEAIKNLNQEAQGHKPQTQVVLNESVYAKEKFCNSFKRLTMSKEQAVCLDELFNETKKLNELSMEENSHPSVLKGIESAKFVCYHRIFHNLTWVFVKQGDQNNAVFTRTMRDAFRHGYLEMPAGFMEVIDEFVASLMNYQKDTSTLFANPHLRHVSFNVTQTLYDQFVAKINSFIQMKSNHTIGDATKSKRQAEVSQLKAAIADIESMSSLEWPIKQSMIVAMMSRIGETGKVAPYAEVYGRLGTHDDNLTILPDQLNKEIFDLINMQAQQKHYKTG